MLRFTYPILLLTVLTAAEVITTQIWMTQPSVLEDFPIQYSGSVINVEDDRSTIIVTGSIIGPPSEQSSIDSEYSSFNKEATRFTFSGNTAFEYKTVWANGMYVNINRCQQLDGPVAYHVTCTFHIYSAWLDTLCSALEEDENLVADQVTLTTVDDVYSTWTISGPSPKWTEDCVPGSDYIGSPGSGIVSNSFPQYSLLITAGGEKLAAQTGAVPTPTDASKTESPVSASSGSEGAPGPTSSGSEEAPDPTSSGSEGASVTVTSRSHSQSTVTSVSQSITGAGNATLVGTGTPPAQTTNAGFTTTPLMGGLASVLMAFLFIL